MKHKKLFEEGKQFPLLGSVYNYPKHVDLVWTLRPKDFQTDSESDHSTIIKMSASNNSNKKLDLNNTTGIRHKLEQSLTKLPDYVSKRLEQLVIRIPQSSKEVAPGERLVFQSGDFKYNYKARSVYKNQLYSQHKDFITTILTEIKNLNGILLGTAKNIIVNEYQKGQSIAKHVDHPLAFGNQILIISLFSSCTMYFQSIDDIKQRVALTIPQNSLLILRDDLRYKWSHEIPPVDQYRASITIRTVNTDYYYARNILQLKSTMPGVFDDTLAMDFIKCLQPL